jgi:HSP20 family protein
MRNLMDRVFDDSLDYTGGTRTARLPIDAYTTDNEIVVTATIPGANPDDVEITVEGESLTIRGHIAPRLENVNYIFAERFHGEFSRTLQLNVPVDLDNIEANFDSGVLTLTLPKAEEVRPRVIKVNTK